MLLMLWLIVVPQEQSEKTICFHWQQAVTELIKSMEFLLVCVNLIFWTKAREISWQRSQQRLRRDAWVGNLRISNLQTAGCLPHKSPAITVLRFIKCNYAYSQAHVMNHWGTWLCAVCVEKCMHSWLGNRLPYCLLFCLLFPRLVAIARVLLLSDSRPALNLPK